MNRTDLTPPKTIIRIENLSHYFEEKLGSSLQRVHVLNQIHLEVTAGESVAIVGASGSGKSTLLHLLGGLERPSEGSVYLNGYELSKTDITALSDIRNQHLGFVYQFHHLLPEFSALENVAMPLLIRRMEKYEALDQATMMLAAVGLDKRIDHRPAELSGGERQRVAVARALVTKPACILADEPTGNLDQRTANQVFELMLECIKAEKSALILVTHDTNLAMRCSRQLQLVNGTLS